ncbi:hypothetical protein PHYBLDRAFT_185853 [Phycomyces blakesleeanus NRRL 1555(-)]|uniref:Uncharacterized protein n=1 Tax=Phycomyces blakesleeanus (strain ATCC 8743b / DSM 1359 / FGSC 10004 / NBRC 33097 / NRRL 1555) TaxID=763407 RepID=A0A167NWY6_PHYB8|nr:hypothetical protein PHYBLDRAFT_185853 [Phycomyces blakesleeanus NRRL 1555(-)]OAD76791.1 hypothetical protein PHYBLDRAFT_185853 [Phycomyces blakesleeanus NRRL 1555(-)]|eukprot:XP_018294831.1 hypothetical protein PHYBLDRAFT_185853 [Phycomyces blakesleeanus NRRL 1555(-)]
MDPASSKTLPAHSRWKPSTWRWIYVSTSVAFATLVVFFALLPTTWGNFFNAHPKRGEMGLGRFIIRGTRMINGKHTPFAYPWRLIEPNRTGRVVAWAAYCIHQAGQWWILAKAQKSKDQQGWSNSYRWWNWSMMYLNGFMLLFKLVHTHVFYDGLAADVAEGTAQGSVVAILVIALILAIPARGIIFGLGRKPKSELIKDVIWFTKKYHGYLVSFGTVYNFHYHPAEGTMGHYLGFVYQVMLLWQSTTFLHSSHRDKSWVMMLELWVFFHGTITALCQPGNSWQIFSFGFVVMFLVNQIYLTPLAKSPERLAVAYAVFAIVSFLAFRNDKKYFKMTFIPVAEYACLIFCIVAGMATSRLVRSLAIPQSISPVFVGVVYILVGVLLTVGLAKVLAGDIRVYDDY